MTKLCAFVPNVMCNGVIIVEASDFTIYKSKNLCEQGDRLRSRAGATVNDSQSPVFTFSISILFQD